MLVVSSKSNLGCEAGCGLRFHARIMLGSCSDHSRIVPALEMTFHLFLGIFSEILQCHFSSAVYLGLAKRRQRRKRKKQPSEAQPGRTRFALQLVSYNGTKRTIPHHQTAPSMTSFRKRLLVFDSLALGELICLFLCLLHSHCTGLLKHSS